MYWQAQVFVFDQNARLYSVISAPSTLNTPTTSHGCPCTQLEVKTVKALAPLLLLNCVFCPNNTILFVFLAQSVDVWPVLTHNLGYTVLQWSSCGDILAVLWNKSSAVFLWDPQTKACHSIDAGLKVNAVYLLPQKRSLFIGQCCIAFPSLYPFQILIIDV